MAILCKRYATKQAMRYESKTTKLQEQLPGQAFINFVIFLTHPRHEFSHYLYQFSIHCTQFKECLIIIKCQPTGRYSLPSLPGSTSLSWWSITLAGILTCFVFQHPKLEQQTQTIILLLGCDIFVANDAAPVASDKSNYFRWISYVQFLQRQSWRLP